MKELAYLMFFIGCGYALNQAYIALTDKDSRKLYVTYPSNAHLNLLWGFLFYAGFAWLTIKDFYFQIILAIIIFVLCLTLVHNYLLKSCLKNSGKGIYAKVLQYKFHRQAQEDKAKDTPYTHEEILKILGLPQDTSPNSALVSTRLQIFSRLAPNTRFPYATDFYQHLTALLQTK